MFPKVALANEISALKRHGLVLDAFFWISNDKQTLYNKGNERK